MFLYAITKLHKKFLCMRIDGLVYGMLLDRHGCHPYAQRQNAALPDVDVDVSDLRHGCPVCSDKPTVTRCSYRTPWHRLYRAYFYRRVFQRQPAQKAQILPVGLQQRKVQLQRAHPSGLRPGLVYFRTDF